MTDPFKPPRAEFLSLADSLLRDIRAHHSSGRAAQGLRLSWAISTRKRAQENVKKECAGLTSAQKDHEVHRDIERALQSLRAAGRIAYRPKLGWCVLGEAAS